MLFYMLLALEIAMAITGLMAVIFNRFPYRPGRPVTGLGAYIGGAIMMLPLVIAFPMSMAMFREQSLADAIGKALILRICFVVVCFPAAYITASLLCNVGAGGRVKREINRKPRRKRRDEEDEDERPRRRRRQEREGRRPPPLPRQRDEDDDDDDDDDRPKPRRGDDGDRIYSRDRDQEPRRRADDDGSYRRRRD